MAKLLKQGKLQHGSVHVYNQLSRALSPPSLPLSSPSLYCCLVSWLFTAQLSSALRQLYTDEVREIDK